MVSRAPPDKPRPAPVGFRGHFGGTSLQRQAAVEERAVKAKDARAQIGRPMADPLRWRRQRVAEAVQHGAGGRLVDLQVGPVGVGGPDPLTKGGVEPEGQQPFGEEIELVIFAGGDVDDLGPPPRRAGRGGAPGGGFRRRRAGSGGGKCPGRHGAGRSAPPGRRAYGQSPPPRARGRGLRPVPQGPPTPCGARRRRPDDLASLSSARLTFAAAGRMPTFVALCYRIAGHVKHSAKEVFGHGPGTSGLPGLFVGRRPGLRRTGR